MRIKPAIGLVVGPVNATHWGQVLSSPSSYAIVEIEDALGNAQQIGVGVLSRLGELLSEEPVSLKEIEEIADTAVRPAVRTLIILVPVGNVVYLVVRGKGSVYVKRGSELASLIHEDGAVSGEVRQHDTILLASSGFSSVLTREELTGLFDHLPPAEIAEKLTLILHEKSGGEGSTAFVFGVNEIVENELEPLVSSPEDAENDGDADVPRKTPVLASWRRRITAGTGRGLQLRQTLRGFLQRFRDHPKKMTAIIAAFFVVLFAVSVILGVKKQAATKQNVRVTAVIADAQHALEEGVALVELNPVKGRERLREGKAMLEPLLSTVSSRTMEGRQIELLNQKLTDNLTIAMHIVEMPLTLFYDVSILKKDAVASLISRDGKTIIISDRATNTVYRMDITTKNAKIAGGGSAVKHVSYAGVHGDSIFVLMDDGVVEMKEGVKEPKLVVKKDDAWGSVTDLSSFGGNIYLLDTQKSRIWKYVAQEKGFSETREYLNPDTLPDLSRATGMSIDGSVYLGTATGSILRFTQGKENTFQPKGVDPAFGTVLTAYTSDDTKNLYVLDVQNTRVVVLDKEGVYVSQYRYTGSLKPTDLVVFEAEKRMVLLADGKLYTIDLK